MIDQPRILGGRYQVGRVIGRGGMALVSQARDLRLSRDVAVKELRIDLAGDPTFQERFRREAQAAAGLNHPNIVSVYDTGEELDPHSQTRVPFIVMELVEGRTLRDILREGRPILPQRALEFTVGVLEALAYSHRAGIVHRDIKPANVMLTTTGIVKVMDFGIARAVSDTSSTMTQTAAVIGTAQYLSPEQARGESVDARSDIYSAGCLLYELLVGRPPFQGDSPVSVAYQHVREQPVPPSQLDPEVTPAMDAVVLKALAKNPDDRYLTAEEMRDDVARILEGRPVTATIPLAGAALVAGEATELMPATAPTVAPTVVSPSEAPVEPEPVPEKPRSRARLWWTLAVVALLLVGLVSGWFLLQQQSRPKQVQVPAVINQTQPQAESALAGVGLKPDIEFVHGPNDATKDRVVTSSPQPGTEVLEGSTVKLTINQGPLFLTVPPGLTGKSFAEAKQALVTAGFNEASILQEEADRESADDKPDTVVAVDPPSGSSVASDSTIRLQVATGRAKVPYVRGKTLAQAEQTLKDAGFTNLATQEAFDPSMKAGEVMSTSPDADTTVQRSEKITIIVSKGPEPTPTPTPTSATPTPTSTPTSASPSPTPTKSGDDDENQ
ncbi:Stk1 family PASTA domain-containing Ser/Thr kinase [Propioniciclava coleopterorum]|uniref:non-specific serine/threonine protein kinase n=1 Tax=Propioniciclava coleopterorum TaxID=2714937 RepID=A0A6G7YB59_9ACTN|nr:Stk1 family PASTA domain-containing Ser/Thr kinase [Propioniciclava coleopterorum]